MTMTYIHAVGLFARHGLAFPATELIEDGWPPAPVRVPASVREPLRDLVPAPLGFGPPQLEGLGDRLPRDGQLQGSAPGVQGGLRAWCTSLLRAGLHIVGMREERGDG